MATTTSGRLVKTSSQYTPEQHAWLITRARRLGETVAVVLRNLVRDEMQREQRQNGEAA